MDETPQTLQTMLAKYYYSETKLVSKDFWSDALQVQKLPPHSIIPSLQINEEFILEVISFLIKLPYQQNSQDIIQIVTQFFDPSATFIKKIIQELVPSLQTETPCLSTLSICLSVLNNLFKHQTLMNPNLHSQLYLYGDEKGIYLDNHIKWPFEKGGTLTFWYKMDSQTKQCKIFQILNQDKVGFQILMKNKKIYIQKLQEETKFRLMKNKSAFLCEALFDTDVKLCIQFQIKKKFFQPYFSINVQMNNFVINGVEIDSINFNNHEFNISMFKKFVGTFYSSMILTEKLASQVEELNNTKGFIYENEIRNFMYIFDLHVKEIFCLFTAIRAITIYQTKEESEKYEVQEGEGKIEKKGPYPKQSILFDAINKNKGRIGEHAVVYQNNFIKKQMGNYGSFSCYVVFLELLEISSAKDELYTTALNIYLEMIKTLFMHKTDSIEQADQINFFHILSRFFQKTKMQGFSYDTISKLKEIYIVLNTRMMREKFIQEIVWGINFALYLSNSVFTNYVKFVKTFYNEDIQSSVHTFGVSKILNYLIDELDNLDCCFEHTRTHSTAGTRIKNYSKLLKEIFQIVENICLIKRVDDDLPNVFIQICVAFSRNVSPCFIEALIVFLQNIFNKDSIVYKSFLETLEMENNCKLMIFSALASCSSWITKGKLILFLLNLLGKKIFQQNGNQKQMITLCSRYPTISIVRPSSLKSQQNRDSIEYSEDKLSLNSMNMNKFVVISPIRTDDLELIDQLSVIQIISDWAFSEQMMKYVSDQIQNPGFFILMELYKGSTYILRRQISKIFLTRIQTIRFTPELMAWAIQCLLISLIDIQDTNQTLKNLIEETEKNLLRMICTYDIQSSEENELSIIKLVFSSVKSKYQDDIIKKIGNKVFLMISQELLIHFEEKLKSQIQGSEHQFDETCERVLSNCFTFMKQYFILKGDEDQMDFEEEAIVLVEEQAQLTLLVLQKMLDLMILVTSPNDRKIIEETNGHRNHFILSLIFPQKEKEQLSFMCLILMSLQTTFEYFEDLNIEWRRKNLILIKRYLIYLIQLSENCENAKLQYLEEELKNIFLNTIGFLENKFYQYFYYPFDRHKNIPFQTQSKIRKNVDELKKTIFQIFVDFIELIKYIDEKGSMEHKSFYELMKPKRKSVHKYSLKNFFPPCWKKADEKIMEFMSLNKETLKKQAQEKLESHIIQKRITFYSSTIEKVVAKKISMFIEEQRKVAQAKQRKSVNFYKTVESQKCKIFSECEEQITLYRLKINQEEKVAQIKRRQNFQKERRELNEILNEIYNKNRVFEGFWTHENFYTFCQNEGSRYDNTLKEFYRRVRSERQSMYGLTPFISIEAIRQGVRHECRMKKDSSYANEIFIEGKTQKKAQKIRKTEKLKIGLQFIKKKMIDKLIKKNSSTQSQIVEKNPNQLFLDVLWIKPMVLKIGHLKINQKQLSFCYNNSTEFQHLSLLKNKLTSDEALIKEWKLQQILCFQVKKFMLKQNAVQIYLKNRTSIFFSFYGKAQSQFPVFIDELTKMKKKQFNIQQIPPYLRVKDPSKEWQKLEITEKWLNYEISNFQYLMCLNIASGRSNCDLNQYPIFPWILAQYSETKFRKNDKKFRDFSKNMGTVGTQERTKKFREIYKNITENHQQQFPFPHFFGFHYSNIAIVIQYLLRLNPYTEGAKYLQGGKFDIPDRIFASLADTYRNATNQMSDVRELTPEFFYLPEFLINAEEHDFGELQVGKKKVNHVELPDGCLNAFDFIENHREYLESREVNESIHQWIDLIFGYKNAGKQAENSNNIYHYLTYESSVPYLNSIQDAQLKQSLESQMMYYGKTPSQLFTKPHPQRALKNENKKNWVKKQFSLFKSEEKESESEIILLQYLQIEKHFVMLKSDGQGVIFQVEGNENLNIKNAKQFKISLNKFQQLQTIDESNNSPLPITVIKDYKIIIGGLWGGKVIVHHIQNKQAECFSKHSQTVTALTYSQKLNCLITGSKNGELGLWDCYQKVAFKEKAFLHSKINSLFIKEDLNVVVSSGDDGIVGVVALENMEILRTLKLPDSVQNCLLLKFPYYMYYIQCKNGQQFCFSLNGQELQTSELEGLYAKPQIMKDDTHHEKVVMLVDDEIIWLKLPDFTIEARVKIGKKIDKMLLFKEMMLFGMGNQLLVYNKKTEKVKWFQ